MLKKLMRSIREYKFASILTPILVIIEVVLEILIPLIMAKMIDMGISGNDEATLIKLGTILIISVFLDCFLVFCLGVVVLLLQQGLPKI